MFIYAFKTLSKEKMNPEKDIQYANILVDSSLLELIFEERRGGRSKMSGNIISEGILAPWKLLFTK